MKFTEIVETLGKGGVVTRKSFEPMEVVFLQIPADIQKDIVPKMTSISSQVKEIILKYAGHIAYHDQAIKYNCQTGAATYYNPTIEDINAEDWVIIKE